MCSAVYLMSCGDTVAGHTRGCEQMPCGGRVAGVCEANATSSKPSPSLPPPRTATQHPACSPAGLHASREPPGYRPAEGRQLRKPAAGLAARRGAQRRQRAPPTHGPQRCEQQARSLPPSLPTPTPPNPPVTAAAGPARGQHRASRGHGARTSSWTFTSAPSVMRYSRQLSLSLLAANMRAVVPSCGGAAVVPHAR